MEENHRVMQDESMQYIFETCVKNKARIEALTNAFFSFVSATCKTDIGNIRDSFQTTYASLLASELSQLELLDYDLWKRIRDDLGLP